MTFQKDFNHLFQDRINNYERIIKMIKSMIFLRLKEFDNMNIEDKYDISQNIWLWLLQKNIIDKVDKDKSPYNFFYTAILRKIIHEKRKLSLKRHDKTKMYSKEFIFYEPSPVDKIIETEDFINIKEITDLNKYKLNIMERDVLFKLIWLNASQADLAKEFDVTRQRISQLKLEAIKKIKKQMKTKS